MCRFAAITGIAGGTAPGITSGSAIAGTGEEMSEPIKVFWQPH